MKFGRWLVLGSFLAAACGGGSSSGGSNSSCTPTSSAAVAITATGISPVNVCVLPQGTVTFTNNDSAATHNIVFETSGCPTIGVIAPGRQASATFPTAENCTFHDASNASNTAFRGTVAVTAGTVTGGGY